MALRGRARRRAAGHRLLRRAAAAGRAARAGWRRPPIDTAVARVLADQVRARPVRAALRRPRPRRGRRRHAGPPPRSPARSPASRSCCCATTASCRWPRTSARWPSSDPTPTRPGTCFGDYTYPAHVESLQEVLRSGQNVFAMPLTDDQRPDDSIADATDRRAPRCTARFGGRVRFARGCDVNGSSRDGFAEAVATRRRRRRRRARDGRQGRAHRRLHQRREPRRRRRSTCPACRRTWRAPCVATGTPVVLVLVAGRPSGSAWLHEQCAAVLMAWLPGARGRRRRSPTCSAATSAPAASCRSRTRARRARSRSSTATRSRAGARTGRATTSTRPSRPLYPFGHGLALHDVRASPAPSVAGDRGAVARRRSPRR